MPVPFIRLQSPVAVLDRAHVDTDQIIPKQFLTRIDRSGFGRCCFYEWRWLADGSPDPDFPLNLPDARGAAILLTGENFGCGSSREHAAWALRDAGFRAIIAPSFADIFAENCVNTGLLPATVAPDVHADLVRRASASRLELAVDLETETLVAPGMCHPFGVTARQRLRLLQGLDPIGVTMQHSIAIHSWESSNR